jgi:2-dehydro-3-deoxygluconokinase
MGLPEVVCFGELLLRLSAPGHERLLQTPRLDVQVGGAEANVAVALAGFGHDVGMLGVVAHNALGAAAVGELARRGVDTRAVRRVAGRMGLYFLEAGAVNRPSRIVYDRAGSAFAMAAGECVSALLGAGRGWFHISGVSPAVSALSAQASVQAVEAALAAGRRVSFDGNYRGQLWAQWDRDGTAPTILRALLEAAELAFINERDLALILQRDFKDRAEAYREAFAVFPRLRAIAATTRQMAQVGEQELAGELVTREGRWVSRVHRLSGVVDRIGAGDAFAAGVLHGLIMGHEPQRVIDFGVAAGALKHSVVGDMLLASAAEVEEAMAGGSLDVRR